MASQQPHVNISAERPLPMRSVDSKPINATLLRRLATRAAIAIAKRFRSRNGRILMLTRRLCVKYGKRVHLSEASAMQFVAQMTSIPVPKVYCAFTDGNITYILMERLDGDMLANGWVYRSEESKARVLSQLKGFVSEMRSIPARGTGVANVDGGSLFDPRIRVQTWRFGPFTSIQAFHKFLHDGLSPGPNIPDAVNSLILRHEAAWPLPKVTHGDLSSLNIIAKIDQVTGIIDWETAGWFPTYWEYTTACQVNPQNSFWLEEIDKFLDPFPDERAIEETRQEYFGDV